MLIASVQSASAFSLALDSVAEWGRFPRFCVDVYRWGDKFFNGYDSTYVTGTGYKFNAKIKTDSWTDYYNFRLPENSEMTMTSDPSTSMGIYLTYLAVSAGYDVNVSKMFTGAEHKRKRFDFGFNCSLLAAEWSYVSNDVGTSIKRLGVNGRPRRVDIPFDGINASEWRLNVYYFFNHKQYSQAAAFNFGRIQRKSQGSLYAGLSFSNQRYNFDFNQLPDDVISTLPPSWLLNNYVVSTYNYAFKLGYGYNWVFKRNWALCISESPVIGLRRGTLSTGVDGDSFALSNRIRASLVWNNGRWFFGLLGDNYLNLIYDKNHTFIASILSVEAAVGFRFNIW